MNKTLIVLLTILIMFPAYSNENNSRLNEIRILTARAEDNRDVDIEKAKKFAVKAVELSKNEGFEKELGEALYQLGIIHCMTGKYSEGEKCFQSSLRIKEKNDDMSGVAGLKNALGQLYRMTGNYIESIRQFKKAIDLKEVMGKERETAISYNNLGITYIELTDYPKALEYCERAWQKANKIGDTTEMINSGTSIANIYYYMKKYDQALKYYNRILKLLSIDNKYNRASLYNNIANTFLVKKNYLKAEEYFKRSLNIAKSEKNKHLIITALINIASSKIRTQNYSAAKDVIRKAEAISMEIRDSISIADINLVYARIYQAGGHTEKAIRKVNKSLTIFESKGILQKMQGGYEQLAGLYSSIGNFKLAYENQSKYFNIWKQIKSDENKSFLEAQRMRIKAENEVILMDKEYQLLQAENQNTKMMLWIFSLAVLILLFIMLFGYIYSKKKKALLEQTSIILRKDENNKTVYKKLSSEFSYILFGISVDIAKMEDKESFNKFSASFKRLSNKYDELIDLVKLETNN